MIKSQTLRDVVVNPESSGVNLVESNERELDHYAAQLTAVNEEFQRGQSNSYWQSQILGRLMYLCVN